MSSTTTGARETRTLALLLTDLVDSTRLAAELGDARAAELWALHDRAARDRFAAHGGREIDKSDGFLLLFDRSEDALRCAAAYHRAIADLDPPLLARAGLHVAPIALRPNLPEDVARGAKPLEVEGVGKALAARVMALAPAGRTLLTDAARGALPPGPSVRSHGFWRFKGVEDPMELFEAVEPGAAPPPPADGPKAWRVVLRNEAWVPVRDVPHALPAERDAFVGRSSDLGLLATRIDEGARLVSVLGPGGSGKTRLVVRHGWTWLGEWPGGVWFCDLSEARDAEGIASAVARALGVPLGTEEPIGLLGRAIGGRGRCLVLLDNFEQVAAYAEETVGRWLDRAPDAVFVVTTREVLGVRGEVALALDPLTEEDACALFVRRAEAADRTFRLAGEDRPTLLRLVALLDRLPLAIELAAARVRVLPPRRLLERLSDRFRLLGGTGRRDRQATLRGTLDWSWDLLAEPERAALAQLSVFEGGFGLEAAEAVLDGLGDVWAADVIQALVDKSLVRVLVSGRFDLLVSVQEYARDRLAERGEREQTELRHARCFARRWPETPVAPAERLAWRVALAEDLDNLVAATRRAVRAAERSTAVWTLRAAWAVIGHRGPTSLGASLLADVGALGPFPAAEAAVFDQVASALAVSSGRPEEAVEIDRRRLERARAHGAPAEEALALTVLALSLAACAGRREEARARFEEALAQVRACGLPTEEVEVLNGLGTLAWFGRRTDEADRRYTDALAVARRVDDQIGLAKTLNNLGMVHRDAGRFAEARASYEAALEIHRRGGNHRSEGIVLINLGVLFTSEGRPADAVRCYEAGRDRLLAMGDRRHLASVLANLAIASEYLGRREASFAAIDGSVAAAREMRDPRLLADALIKRGNLLQRADPAASGAAYAEAREAARAVGPSPLDAMILSGEARLAELAGSPEQAAEQLAAAVEVARDQRDRSLLTFALAALGRQAALLGREAQARAALREAAALAAEVGAGGGPNRVSILGEVAEAELALGDRAAALRALDEAEDLAARLGVSPRSEIAIGLARVRGRVRAA